MTSNEEPVFDHIENLLEAESMLYSSSSPSSSFAARPSSMQAADWKNRMRSSPFKKSLRKETSANTSYGEEASPFDESLPFDESFGGLEQFDDTIEKENMEQGNLFNESVNLSALKEEDESNSFREEEEDTKEASPQTDLFWYRNDQYNYGTNHTYLMNEVIDAEGCTPVSSSVDRSMESSMERSMEIAASDAYDELSGIIGTTPRKSPKPTQDQQFVMDILAAPVDSPVKSPAASFTPKQSPIDTKSVQTSPFDEQEYNPYGKDEVLSALVGSPVKSRTTSFVKPQPRVQTRKVRANPFDEQRYNPYGKDEMEELDHALNTLSLNNVPSTYVAEEPAISPYKKDLVAINPTPITPPPNRHDMYIDSLQDTHSDSDDEEARGIVRIQLTDEDVYGSDFDAKSLAEHPVLGHEHNFSLHRNVQVNAVDTFRDEEVPNTEGSGQALEARVMGILTPLRNIMLTPQKWKRSPKTPDTEGESPSSSRDVEGGLRQFGDAIIRSDLSKRFQVAMGMGETEEEFIDWKNRNCTPRQIYLISILVVLVIAFICVVSVMVGMQNNKGSAQEGMNDFYKVTGDDGGFSN